MRNADTDCNWSATLSDADTMPCAAAVNDEDRNDVDDVEGSATICDTDAAHCTEDAVDGGGMESAEPADGSEKDADNDAGDHLVALWHAG